MFFSLSEDFFFTVIFFSMRQFTVWILTAGSGNKLKSRTAESAEIFQFISGKF